MTREFENFIHIFGCGALGKSADEKNCIGIKSIRDIAIRQNSWPIVYSALRKKLMDGSVKIPPEIFSELEKTHFSNIALNIQKTEFNKTVLAEFEKNAVEYCLFKGTVLARLYAEPETRISSDTDVLIKPSDEERVVCLLKTLGYTVKEREKHENEIQASHPIGGELEIHVRMNFKTVDDLVFEDKIEYNEPYRNIANIGTTLGIYDGLVHTATHFIKHFVKSGVGVRHIMDMLLYMKHYEKELDFDKFNSFMKELKYNGLIDAAKSVGLKYWGMEFDNFKPVSDEVLDAFLTDIEAGGVFGRSDRERADAYRVFAQRRSSMTSEQFNRYSVNNLDQSLFNKIFPEVKRIKKLYPDVGENKIKIIGAYFRRWYKLIRDIVMRKKTLNQYVYRISKTQEGETVKNRIALMEKLGMIDRS